MAAQQDLTSTMDAQTSALEPFLDKIVTMLNETEKFAELPEVFPIRVVLFRARELLAEINSIKPQLKDVGLPENKREELEVRSITSQAQAEGCVRAAESWYKEWRAKQPPQQQAGTGNSSGSK